MRRHGVQRGAPSCAGEQKGGADARTATPVAGLGQGVRGRVAGGACGDAAGDVRRRAAGGVAARACGRVLVRARAPCCAAPAPDGGGGTLLLARRRADVTRAWVAALHFDYDGRFLCYSFGMGECNDLSPAVNAVFTCRTSGTVMFQLS